MISIETGHEPTVAPAMDAPIVDPPSTLPAGVRLADASGDNAVGRPVSDRSPDRLVILVDEGLNRTVAAGVIVRAS